MDALSYVFVCRHASASDKDVLRVASFFYMTALYKKEFNMEEQTIKLAYNHNLKISLLALGVIGLVITPFDLPMEYYFVLKIYVFLICLLVIASNLVYQKVFKSLPYYKPFSESKYNDFNRGFTSAFFVVIMLLFNPVVQFYFYEKTIWLIIDYISAGIFMMTIKGEIVIKKDVLFAALKKIDWYSVDSIKTIADYLRNNYRKGIVYKKMDNDWYMSLICELYTIIIYKDEKKTYTNHAKYFRLIGNAFYLKHYKNVIFNDDFQSLNSSMYGVKKIYLVNVLYHLRWVSISRVFNEENMPLIRDNLVKHEKINGQSAISNILTAVSFLLQYRIDDYVSALTTAKAFSDYDKILFAKIEFKINSKLEHHYIYWQFKKEKIHHKIYEFIKEVTYKLDLLSDNFE